MSEPLSMSDTTATDSQATPVDPESTSTGGRLWLHRAALVLGCFLVLLVWRFDVLDLPPYWDSVQGPYLQAAWLEAHGFDFSLLMQQEGWPNGPNVYPISILPPLWAVVMRLADSPAQAWMVLHLCQFLLAGLIFMALHQWLRQDMKQPYWLALGAAAAVVIHPAMGGQIDTLTMEIWVATPILYSAWMVSRRRYLLAGILGCLAMLAKESALVLSLALIIVTGIMLVGEAMTWRRRLGLLAAASAPLSLKVVMEVLKKLGNAPESMSFFAEDLPTGLHGLMVALPLQPVLFGGFFLLLLSAPFVLWRLGLVAVAREEGNLAALRQFLAGPTNRAYLTCAVIVCGSTALLMLPVYFLTRYIVWYLALYFMSIMAIFLVLRLPRWLIGVFLLGCLGYYGANQHGQLFEPLPVDYQRSGDRRERSREVVEDIRLIQDVTAWLDANAGDQMIIAPAPIDRILAMPEYGYVSRPLNSVSYSFCMEYPPIPCTLNLNEKQFHQALYFNYALGYNSQVAPFYNAATQTMYVAHYATTETTPDSPIMIMGVKAREKD